MRAWPATVTRRFGVGDLGLRAVTALSREASCLLARERFDVVYITTYPVYPAVIGPRLRQRHGVTFVLDLQDPWVGSWGLTVGPGGPGAPDLKSRASRYVSRQLETRVVPHADAITAVSRRTFDELADREPAVRGTPFLELPIGGDGGDLEAAAVSGVNRVFDPADGLVHVCSVGTLLPRGGGVLAAVMRAVAALRDRRPAAYARLRLHFIGTSNQTDPSAPPRAVPIAAAHGVAEVVSELPGRLDYLDSLAIQRDAHGLLLLGSDEPHYTASKIYPALIVNRPIVAVYHAASSGVEVFMAAGNEPRLDLVTFADERELQTRDAPIADALGAIAGLRYERQPPPAPQRLGRYAALSLAVELARFFERLPVTHAA